jgi:hypothetical protein
VAKRDQNLDRLRAPAGIDELARSGPWGSPRAPILSASKSVIRVQPTVLRRRRRLEDHDEEVSLGSSAWSR